MPKKTRSPFAELVELASQKLSGGRESLAKELGVSESTVARWYSGASRPRPELEGQLRAVAEQASLPYGGSQSSLFEWPDSSCEERLRRAVTLTCKDLRETFHRRGTLSSRQEALDELGKLLFAHVMSSTHGGQGIGRYLASRNPATALREFVEEQYRVFAPVSLSHELKKSDFELRLRENDDDLAMDLIGCFDHLRESDLLASIRGLDSVDVLNDAFGQFIADSFVQEKELGQYLTPNEVVRFMVRLGFSALSDPVRQLLLNPSTVKTAGLLLDPSCGVGTFLTEALRVMYSECRRQFGVDGARTLVENALHANVVGIDRSERMLRLALSNLAMFGASKVNLHLANSLARSGSDGELTASLEGKASLILTNPPFGANFRGSHLHKYRLATEWSSRRPQSVDSELLFLERYLDWLAPSGHLVAVVPDSVLTNKGIFQDLRGEVFQQARVMSVISLPAVTFGVAGTGTKTSVLHLVKRPQRDRTSVSVFFGVCERVGYEVQTRGATRVKISSGVNQLPELLEGFQGRIALPYARLRDLSIDDSRWDAVFHAGISASVEDRIARSHEAIVRVRDIAELSVERLNPARLGAARTFKYIEISDVDGESCSVRAKDVPCADAPSRARKLVRAGDVLVSTVRPERRTIGVVPGELDGAVCSTGFAVLRCHGVHPLLLAQLLRHEFSTEQIVKENSGIAYPVIEEERVLDVALPIDRVGLEALTGSARTFEKARIQLDQAGIEFDRSLQGTVAAWMTA